ncbi:hypothetical protein GOODEAATRI_031331, partial [Goodea atripinnis]
VDGNELLCHHQGAALHRKQSDVVIQGGCYEIRSSLNDPKTSMVNGLGSTVRSTFHGGQIRDRRPPSHAPPASPTPSHDASPLPHVRSRAPSNLLSKITSKLTRK